MTTTDQNKGKAIDYLLERLRWDFRLKDDLINNLVLVSGLLPEDAIKVVQNLSRS